MDELSKEQIKRCLFWLQYPRSWYCLIAIIWGALALVGFGFMLILKSQFNVDARDIEYVEVLIIIVFVITGLGTDIFVRLRKKGCARNYELLAYVLSPNSKHKSAWSIYALRRKVDGWISGYAEGRWGVDGVPYVPILPLNGYAFKINDVEHLGKPCSAQITMWLEPVEQEKILLAILEAGLSWFEWQKLDYDAWVAAGQRSAMVHLNGSTLDDCRNMEQSIQADLTHDVSSGRLTSLRDFRSVTVEIVSPDPPLAMLIHRV